MENGCVVAPKDKPWQWTPNPAGGYAIAFENDTPVKYRKIG